MSPRNESKQLFSVLKRSLIVYIQLQELFITTYQFQTMTLLLSFSVKPLCGDSDLNLDTGLDVDDDLLDNLGGSVEVDEACERN